MKIPHLVEVRVAPVNFNVSYQRTCEISNGSVQTSLMPDGNLERGW
jgi:hypothetical protein